MPTASYLSGAREQSWKDCRDLRCTWRKLKDPRCTRQKTRRYSNEAPYSLMFWIWLVHYGRAPAWQNIQLNHALYWMPFYNLLRMHCDLMKSSLQASLRRTFEFQARSDISWLLELGAWFLLVTLLTAWWLITTLIFLSSFTLSNGSPYGAVFLLSLPFLDNILTYYLAPFCSANRNWHNFQRWSFNLFSTSIA